MDDTTQDLNRTADHVGADAEQDLADARNPATSPERLAALCILGDERVAWRIARNQGAPPKVLAHLADHENAEVRWGVGGNPTTPVEVLDGLARDKNSYVVAAVASNPRTPVDVLIELHEHTDDVDVMEQLAGNECTPSEVLEELASESDEWYVRSALARNPRTPTNVLKVLAAEDDIELRLDALDQLAQRVTTLDPRTRLAVELADEDGLTDDVWAQVDAALPPEREPVRRTCSYDALSL